MLRFVVCVAAVAACFPPGSWAQDNRRKTFLTVAEAGPDYSVQGEYLGTSGGRRMGLQVVARGNGAFEAVLLQGGLPGAGWDRSEREKLKGSRQSGDDSRVRLAGQAKTIEIVGNRAELKQGDKLLGRLSKVNRVSPTMGSAPPRGAKVLFRQGAKSQLKGGKVTEGDFLNVNVRGGVTTEFPVGDFRLHLEFRTPFMPFAKGQARSNSGVYIQRRYEVQILDSFGLDGVANECGGLYRQQAPDLNMCLPPLRWQTYDIYFTAARWSGDKKTANARITVYHNGVPIHSNREIPKKTGAGRPEADTMLPIHFQDHSNPVYLRNVWLVDTSAKPTRYATQAKPRRRLLSRFWRCRWRRR